MQKEQNFNEKCEEKRIPKVSFLFRKMFELRGDTVFALKCGDLNLKQKTKKNLKEFGISLF